MTPTPLDRYQDLIAEELSAYQSRLERAAGDLSGVDVNPAEGTDLDTGDRSSIPAELQPAMAGFRRCLDFLHQTKHTQFDSQSPPQTNEKASTYLMPGRIGRFEVLRQLGVGGFGIVFLCIDLVTRRQVAVKVPRPELLTSAELIERFSREATAVAQLEHPNILPVYESDYCGSIPYIVTPYVEGQTLAHWIAEHHDVTPQMAAEIVRQLALGVGHAHERGVLHRDLKPGNVLLAAVDTPEHQQALPFVPKLTDFGLAKCLEGQQNISQSGAVVGTPYYMSPEQAEGRTRDITARSDVYGLGAVLYELLTGVPPLRGQNQWQTLQRISQQEPQAPRTLRGNVPLDLEVICLKCLDKNPGRRCESSQELADELDRYLRGQPIKSRPIGVFERVRRWCRRRPAFAALAGFSSVAAVVIGWLMVASHLSLQRLNGELGTALLKAQNLQQLAESYESAAKDNLYAADLSRAAIAWKQDDTRELTELLDRHIPQPGEPDRRGFEWGFLYRQAHLAKETWLIAPSAVYVLRPSPDHRILATGGKDSVLRLINMETRELLQEFPTHQLEINGIAFSTDGQRLATAGDDGTVRIWEARTASLLCSIRTSFRKAYQVEFLPGDQSVVCCGLGHDLDIFDIPSGQRRSSLVGHQNVVETFAIDPNLNRIISASNDESIRCWDLSQQALINRADSPGSVESLLLVPDRKLCITANATGELRTIDLRDGRELGSIRQLDRLTSLALHPAGELLAIGDINGQICLYRLSSAGQIRLTDDHPWQGHVGRVHSLTWTQDGSRLISAGADGHVAGWNIERVSKSALLRLTLDQAMHDWPIKDMPVVVYRRDADKALMRWRTQPGQFPVASLNSHFRSHSLSLDGRYLAIFDEQDDVTLFEVPADPDQPIDAHRVTSQRIEGIRYLYFTADSHSLIAVRVQRDSEGNEIAVEIQLLSVPTLSLTAARFDKGGKGVSVSRAGPHVVYATAQELVFWDLSTNQTVWSVPQQNVICTAISPDGKLVAAALANRKIIIRDTATGARKIQISSAREISRRMVFSPDGRSLITAGAGGDLLNIFHVKTGQLLVQIPRIGSIDRLEFPTSAAQLFCETDYLVPTKPREILVLDGTIDDIR